MPVPYLYAKNPSVQSARTVQPAYLSPYQCAMRAGCTLLARRIRRCGAYATMRYCAKRGVPLELALYIFAGRRNTCHAA